MGATQVPSVAVVTGASSGIGEQTAYALARRGYHVVVAARRLERLEAVAQRCRQMGAAAMAVATDVADAAAVRSLVAVTLDQFGRLDVMVNNAGSGLFAPFDQTTEQQMRDIFDVNFYGVFHGCQAVIPVMRRQGGGHIFNVSSVVGKRGTPFHSAYCATKFALCGLDESMRIELRGENIRVTTVCPALTDTEFFGSSRRGRGARRSFERFRGLTAPAVIGEKIAASVGHNRPELVFTLGGKFLAKLAALSPRMADWIMTIYYKDLVRRLGNSGTDTETPDTST